MQLFNQLIVILIAATTGANALGCINGGGEEPPVPMNEYWQKAVAAMKKMVEDGTKDGTNAIVGDAPPWRDEEACKHSDICLAVHEIVSCYDEKTTVFRIGDDFNITLKTGDVTLSDKTKGNVCTDIEPIKGFILREAQIIKSQLGNMQTPSTASMGSNKAAATATRSETETGSEANLAATSAAEPVGSDDKDGSAAGKSAASWFAGAVALAAMVVV